MQAHHDVEVQLKLVLVLVFILEFKSSMEMLNKYHLVKLITTQKYKINYKEFLNTIIIRHN